MPFRGQHLLQRDDHRCSAALGISGCRIPRRHNGKWRQRENLKQRSNCSTNYDTAADLPIGARYQRHSSPYQRCTESELYRLHRYVNSTATCNGSNLLATYGIAVGTNGGGAGCGNKQISNYPTPDTNPGCPTSATCATGYNQYLANSGISATALGKCSGSYPQYAKKTGYPTTISNLSQLQSFSSGGTTYYVACGDTQLSSNITSPPGNTVIVVENGNLDSGSSTLSTNSAAGSGLTVVFSGTADTKSVTYGHAPTGNGTFDIDAPTTGNWSGVAFYQDPSLTGTGVNVSYAGNSPTWNITGLVYMPNSSMTISGAVNKSAHGADCMVTIAASVLINGTGSIYSQTPDGSGCKQAGLNQPTALIPGRAELVY